MALRLPRLRQRRHVREPGGYSSDARSVIRKGTLLGVRGSDTVAVLGKDGSVACASVRGGVEPLAPDLETFIREDIGRIGVG